MNWQQAGIIALNIDLVLYSLMYFPQLWHNCNRRHLRQMSFGFHATLFIAITVDLYYAIGFVQHWQYIAVDAGFWLYLLIQHMQRLRVFTTPKERFQHHVLLSLVLLFSLGAISQRNLHWSPPVYNALGWIANIGFWLSGVPQIVRNYMDKKAEAINRLYLIFGFAICSLDGFCAWTLNWGSATRYGFILPIMIKFTLYYQSYAYATEQDTNQEATPCTEDGLS